MTAYHIGVVHARQIRAAQDAVTDVPVRPLVTNRQHQATALRRGKFETGVPEDRLIAGALSGGAS